MWLSVLTCSQKLPCDKTRTAEQAEGLHLPTKRCGLFCLQDFGAQSQAWPAPVPGTAKRSFCAREEEQHADILFFLIVLLMYIQALEVRVLKDACFLLLISLKPNVGRKRNEQCVPHCQFIKRDRQFLKRALALANKRQTSVHKSCSEQTINQDLENNTEEHFYKPQSLYELWDSDEHLRACLRLL